MKTLIKRSFSGTVYVSLIVLALLWFPPLFPVLAAVFLGLCLKEFFGISIGKSLMREQILAIISAETAFMACFCCLRFNIDSSFLYIPLVTLLLIPVSMVLRCEISLMPSFTWLAAGLCYIALPFAFLPLLVVKSAVFDGSLLLFFFIIIWAADVGAYALGTLLGQKESSRKLAPSLSPKKSWWGFWGGLLAGVAAAVVSGLCGLVDIPLYHLVAIGLISSAASVAGDLFESMWKRHFSVKDSGNLMPGHGGMLDRLDSSLMAMPAAGLYMTFFSLW